MVEVGEISWAGRSVTSWGKGDTFGMSEFKLILRSFSNQ